MAERRSRRGAGEEGDSLFAARVGAGVLLASALDHTEDAGRWLLDALVGYAHDARAEDLPALDPREVRRWTLETMQR